jgi:hypothetical protein
VRRRTLVFLGLLTVLVSAQEADRDFIRVTQPAPLPIPLASAVAAIETPRIKAHMVFLTDPRQEGRGLGTRGLEATVRYLEAQLKAAALLPFGVSYRQAVPMREVRPGKSLLRLRLRSGTFTFRPGRNAVLPPIEPGMLSGSIVFAGHGIQEPGLGHDDFRGLDVRGKIVVFLGSLPTGPAWQKPELIEKYASERLADRYDSRLALLEKLGARGAIALEEGLDRRIMEGKEPAQPYFLAAPGVHALGEPPLVRIATTPELQDALQTNPGGTVQLVIRGHVRPIQGFNLLARLVGTDPTLRREAVLIGAHMDHLGMPGGILHPGADDNASGVAALLEIIRTLAANPVRPRRTILFAFWTGEEEGKFGSSHYTRHPRWPLAATTYLNLDMIAHPWTAADLHTLLGDSGLKDPKAFLDGLDPAHFAEPGLPPGHPELTSTIAQAGHGTGMSLHLDWTDGRNGGSDYRDFARLNVPFVRFFGSYFPDYHKSGDTLDKLDPEQVARMARLVLATAWLLADR